MIEPEGEQTDYFKCLEQASLSLVDDGQPYRRHPNQNNTQQPWKQGNSLGASASGNRYRVIGRHW